MFLFDRFTAKTSFYIFCIVFISPSMFYNKEARCLFFSNKRNMKQRFMMYANFLFRITRSLNVWIFSMKCKFCFESVLSTKTTAFLLSLSNTIFTFVGSEYCQCLPRCVKRYYRYISWRRWSLFATPGTNILSVHVIKPSNWTEQNRIEQNRTKTEQNKTNMYCKYLYMYKK